MTRSTTSMQKKSTPRNSKEQLNIDKPVQLTDLENNFQNQGSEKILSKSTSLQKSEISTSVDLSFNNKANETSSSKTSVTGPGYGAPPVRAQKPKTMVIPLKNGQKTAISVRPLPKSVGFKWPSAKQKLVNSTTDQTGQDAGVYCNPDLPSQVVLFLKL